MKIGHKIFLNITTIILLFYCAVDLHAQTSRVDSLVTRGDELREAYRFRESADLYSEALRSFADTLTAEDSAVRINVSEKLLLSENGLNMTGFVYSPSVVARHIFSKDEFFLYYPLKDRAWREVPNQLDSVGGVYSRAIYAPAEDGTIYYSAEDREGIRNIYRTSFADSVWTQPSLINEQMTSASDEIYPMLSPDGKSMFFASKGLYGVGGYDLYVSQWDEAVSDWSTPVNMGFPYSSPANDFLLINTDDGRYTIFASDRGCPLDSVWIYVLEYDNMPVRKEITDYKSIAEIACLEPESGAGDLNRIQDVKSEIPENVDTKRYMDKMAQVRSLRDSISACEKKLEGFREKYSIVADEDDKRKISEDILMTEAEIPLFQSRLDEAVKQLQDIEMDFLFSGVVIDPDALLEEAEREVVSESPDYTFVKMDMGEPLTLEFEQLEPKFDYSFKILEEGQFAEDNSVPSGVIYQIQIFSTGSKASVKNIKGLSPVFETRSASGRYIYRVGLFTTYRDVLSKLNAVKRLGFRNAYIVGYVDGKEMSVTKVRNVEAERAKVSELYSVSIIPSGDNLDTVAMDGIRQQSAGKDIARGEEGFIVGPFDSRTDAVALVEFVEVMGYGDAKLEIIQKQ